MIEIDPRIDVVFKNLFGSPEHPRLTMSFVNSLLTMAGLPKAVQLTIQCRDETTGRILHEDLCIVTIELPVWTQWLKAQKTSIIDPEGKWLYFLTKAKGMDEEKLLATLADPEFTEAMEVIKGYTTEQKQRHAYDMRENYQRILASYRATDFDEGKADIVQAIKAKGYSAEQIAEITGLPLAQIETLLQIG